MSSQDSTKAILDARIDAERAALHVFLDERILPLMVRRASLIEELSAGASARHAKGGRADAPAVSAKAPASKALAGKAPAVKAPIANDASPKASPAKPPRPKAVEGGRVAPAPGRGSQARAARNSIPNGADNVPLQEFPTWLRTSPRWSAARVVMAMLEHELDDGLPGLEINRTLVSWGYSIDTAEFVKTRLRHLGVLRFDVGTKAWIPTQAYRDAIPPSSAIELTMADRGRAKPPEEHTGGKLVLRLLAEGRPEGMLRDDICNAVVAAGYSYSLGRHGHHQLAFMGRIAIDPATNRWTIAGDPGKGGTGR